MALTGSRRCEQVGKPVRLDFRGLQDSLLSLPSSPGRGHRTAPSIDNDSVFSFDASVSDIPSSAISCITDSDSDAPLAVSPVRRRPATPRIGPATPRIGPATPHVGRTRPLTNPAPLTPSRDGSARTTPHVDRTRPPTNPAPSTPSRNGSARTGRDSTPPQCHSVDQRGSLPLQSQLLGATQRGSPSPRSSRDDSVRRASTVLQPSRAFLTTRVPVTAASRTFRDVGVNTDDWIPPRRIITRAALRARIAKHAASSSQDHAITAPPSKGADVGITPLPQDVDAHVVLPIQDAPDTVVPPVTNTTPGVALTGQHEGLNGRSPTPIDDEANYWSAEDEMRPYNYGFGDGYVSEHDTSADGWYCVTVGFKVGIFSDAIHQEEVTRRCSSGMSKKHKTRARAQRAFMRALDRGGVCVVAR